MSDLDADLRAFERDCREQSRELERVLPAIVTEAAALVESEVRRRAPRRTGALVSHLDSTAARRRSSATATVQIEDSAGGGEEHYAVYDEYGTSTMPAKPFFRPGVEAARERAEDLIEQKLDSVIAAHDR
jgi:HK97 gp10 family phage protein